MTPNELLAIATTTVSVVVAIAWFFWQRYQSLEKRLRRIEAQYNESRFERDKLHYDLQLFRQAEQGNVDRLELMCNGNRELIEHRTKRFSDCLKDLEGRLGGELREVKGWLDANTEFRLRDR